MHTKNGKLLISIILGIGAATLFRKICTDISCLDFRAPDIKDVEKTIYSHNDDCYSFTSKSVTCNSHDKQFKL